MSSLAVVREGLRRVNAAPMLVVGVTVMTLLVALPLSLALRDMIEKHLGPSLAATAAAESTNHEWWQEFGAQATGLGQTFTPSVVGFGAVLDNLSAFLDNSEMASTILGVTAAWLLIWSFLSGGILDRLARGRRTRAHGFFSACGVHFWRFLRIGLFAWFVYAFLFGYVHHWIFEDLYPRLIRDLTVERTAALLRAGGYLLFGLLLVFVNVIFDFARIRTVVEDRRSAIGAIAAGARFVRRHIGRVALVYLMNGTLFVLLVGLYGVLNPGAPGAGAAMWLALLAGQLYIVLRHYLKLVFYASETVLFQSALAHAGYTAAAPVVWPDSPAAETIGNFDSMSQPSPADNS
jgi:hypothetical protein